MPTEIMNSEPGKLSQFEAEEYLENLQALTRELDRAMAAIVEQELPSLQDSLHVQRATCDQLTHLARRSKDRPISKNGSDASPLDPDLAIEIKAAADALLVLNRNYSALLRHSGDTLRLFAGLFSGYQGPANTAPGNQANLNTWSCEL